MKRFHHLLLLTVFFHAVDISAQRSRITVNETVAHYLLQKELDAMDTIPLNLKTEKLHLLDSLLLRCSGNLPKYDKDFNKKQAFSVFRKIDSICYAFGMFTCYPIGRLNMAFSKRDLTIRTRNDFDCEFYRDTISYRNKYLEELAYAFTIDCDLTSILYYSVGELKGYPITMVEVPRHNFVRWTFKNGKHLNWDTNAAIVCDDDCYRNGKSPTVHRAFSKDVEEKAGFLKDMRRDEILGYYMPFTAVKLKNSNQQKQAESIYLKALRQKKPNINASYFLAYMYVYSNAFDKPKYARKALELSKWAYLNMDLYVLYEDTIKEIRETYACSCAANKDFTTALSILKEKSKVDQALERGFEAGCKCNEIYPNRR